MKPYEVRLRKTFSAKRRSPRPWGKTRTRPHHQRRLSMAHPVASWNFGPRYAAAVLFHFPESKGLQDGIYLNTSEFGEYDTIEFYPDRLVFKLTWFVDCGNSPGISERFVPIEDIEFFAVKRLDKPEAKPFFWFDERDPEYHLTRFKTFTPLLTRLLQVA